MTERICIVLPTYNEAQNIGKLLLAISQVTKAETLVVDDSSPDGTASIVKEISARNPAVHLLTRPCKVGLGPAYAEGLTWAIDQGFDRIIQMDCDFSHDPNYINKLIEKSSLYDLVVGSKYVQGGGVIGLPLSRMLLSRYGNLYIRTILKIRDQRFSIRDTTSGYMCWRRELLSQIDFKRLQCFGYGFLIELKWLAVQLGARINEIPIEFRDRTKGQSKFSPSIAFEAIRLPLRVHELVRS